MTPFHLELLVCDELVGFQAHHRFVFWEPENFGSEIVHRKGPLELSLRWPSSLSLSVWGLCPFCSWWVVEVACVKQGCCLVPTCSPSLLPGSMGPPLFGSNLWAQKWIWSADGVDGRMTLLTFISTHDYLCIYWWELTFPLYTELFQLKYWVLGNLVWVYGLFPSLRPCIRGFLWWDAPPWGVEPVTFSFKALLASTRLVVFPWKLAQRSWCSLLIILCCQGFQLWVQPCPCNSPAFQWDCIWGTA